MAGRQDKKNDAPGPGSDRPRPQRSLSDSEVPTLFGPAITLHPATPKAKVAPKRPQIDDRSGHRERLRDRFLTGGEDAIPDYELLELVLFRAIPRQDVKPLAKTLLAEFKSFPGVVHATPARLKSISGVGPRVVEELKLIRAAAVRLTRREVNDREPLNSWQSVLDYLKAVQGHDDKESFRILFLDKRNQLLADEVQSRGTVDHTPVYVREVISRALELAATAVILVHNHPSGDPSPSRADIDMTKMIMAAGKPLGVQVHDHVIVGRHGHHSMKSSRLL